MRGLSLDRMSKERLREAARQAGDIESEASIAVASGLFSWLSGRLPGTIAFYVAMSDEVDLSGLVGRLPGWRWVLPRIEEDRSLTFRDRDLPRETHPWGMVQPIDSGPAVPVLELDVILVPGLAFGRSGDRLGRGGGYYDRALSQRRSDCDVVGVTVVDRLIESLPTEDHDQRVDWLATEEGVSWCSPRR